MQRTFPGLAELLPDPRVFQNITLIKTPERNFSSQSYEDLFSFLECSECQSNSRNLVRPNVSFPMVDVVCLHGTGIQSTLTLSYASHSPSKEPTIINGDGDGLVNLVSLEYCKSWLEHGSEFEIKYATLPGAKHNDLIKNDETVSKVLRYL